MGIVVRQSLKGTVISYIGVLIGVVNTLWLLPYMLSAEQIGLYRVLVDIATLLMIFSQLGFLNAGIRFFPQYKEPENQHQGFLFFMLIMVLGGFGLVSILLVLFKSHVLNYFAENSALLLDFSYVVLPLTFSILFFSIFETYARSLLRIVIPKLFKEVVTRLFISIAAIAFFLNLIGFEQFIESLILIYFLILCGIIIYVRSLGQLFLKPNFTIFRSSNLKSIFEYCFFTLLLAGSGIIVGKIDTIMLSSQTNLTATGIYSIAFYMGIMVEIPKRAMVNISAPLVAEYFVKDQIDKIEILYKKTSTHLMLAGGIILALIWFNIDDIFTMMPNSEVYSSGKWVVLLIGLAKFIDLTMSINTEILSNSKKYKWNLILMPFLAIMAVGTNYILIPMYGLTGAAIATLISIGLYNIFRFIVVFFFYRVHPFSRNTMKCVLIFILLVIAGIYTPTTQIAVVNILIKSVVMGIIALTGILVLKPSEELTKLSQRLLGYLKIK